MSSITKGFQFRDSNYNPIAYDGSPITWRVSCYGLYIKDKQLLVIKNKEENFWDIPGGGIEPHESIAEGLARESQEEAGWHFELGTVFSSCDGWFFHSSEKRFYHSLQLYSHITTAQHIGNPTDSKTQHVKFVNLDEVAQLPVYPNAVTALAKLQNQKLV